MSDAVRTRDSQIIPYQRGQLTEPMHDDPDEFRIPPVQKLHDWSVKEC